MCPEFSELLVAANNWSHILPRKHTSYEKSRKRSSYPNTCSYKTVTRWGSTLAMLERLMEQQAPIAAVLMDGRVRHLMPEGEEWSIIGSTGRHSEAVPANYRSNGCRKVPNTEHSQATSL